MRRATGLCKPTMTRRSCLINPASGRGKTFQASTGDSSRFPILSCPLLAGMIGIKFWTQQRTRPPGGRSNRRNRSGGRDSRNKIAFDARNRNLNPKHGGYRTASGTRNTTPALTIRDCRQKRIAYRKMLIDLGRMALHGSFGVLPQRCGRRTANRAVGIVEAARSARAKTKREMKHSETYGVAEGQSTLSTVVVR